MCREILANKQGHRIKQLSKDTAINIHHTCHGMVDLCRYLLATTHEYVCLGQFTIDFLEKEFSKITSRDIFYISTASS